MTDKLRDALVVAKKALAELSGADGTTLNVINAQVLAARVRAIATPALSATHAALATPAKVTDDERAKTISLLYGIAIRYDKGVAGITEPQWRAVKAAMAMLEADARALAAKAAMPEDVANDLSTLADALSTDGSQDDAIRALNRIASALAATSARADGLNEFYEKAKASTAREREEKHAAQRAVHVAEAKVTALTTLLRRLQGARPVGTDDPIWDELSAALSPSPPKEEAPAPVGVFVSTKETALRITKPKASPPPAAAGLYSDKPEDNPDNWEEGYADPAEPVKGWGFSDRANAKSADAGSAEGWVAKPEWRHEPTDTDAWRLYLLDCRIGVVFALRTPRWGAQKFDGISDPLIGADYSTREEAQAALLAAVRPKDAGGEA